MRLLGVLVVLVGCHGAGSVAPDASTEPDVPPRSQGMTVTWNARPSVPGMITDKIIVTDAVFQLEHLQLVSDAGGTTHTRLQLSWSSQGTPPDEEFPGAPTARYQQILLDMRSDVHPPFSYAYQIEGMWQDDGNSRPFRIADPTILEVPIACDVTLPANGSVTVPVRLDLRNALNGVDFKSLQMKDGVLVPDVSQLADLRDALTHAFVLDN
ncbi:MAG TPA: hypothetical protein VF516_37490 [Kofleriaceae bacterium]